MIGSTDNDGDDLKRKNLVLEPNTIFDWISVLSLMKRWNDATQEYFGQKLYSSQESHDSNVIHLGHSIMELC